MHKSRLAGHTRFRSSAPSQSSLSGGNDSSSAIPWAAIEQLQKGAPLLKFGRHGDPHFRFFSLSADCNMLTWYSEKKRNAADCAVLLFGTKLQAGQKTDVFKKNPRIDLESVSFSILYPEKSNKGSFKSLDLVCKDKKEFTVWYSALQYLSKHRLTAEQLATRCDTSAFEAITTAVQDSSSGPAKPVQAELERDLQKSLRNTCDMYSWGSNNWEQLGVPGVLFRDVPIVVQDLLGKGIKQVACGSEHTLAITASGELYAWGRGSSGRLGNGSHEPVSSPQRIVVRNPSDGSSVAFEYIACGDMHSIGVSSSGAVYTWGCGISGQLGHGTDEDVLEPTIVESLVGCTITAADGGLTYSAFVDEGGRVYTCGTSVEGALGLDGTTQAYTPNCVTALAHDEIVSISCGHYHAGAVSKSGWSYVWGSNAVGQLSIPAVDQIMTPSKPEGVPRGVICISCGAAHTAFIVERVLSRRKEVLTCGAGMHGQLGYKPPVDEFTRAQPVLQRTMAHRVELTQDLGQPFLASCGDFHTAIVTDSGHLFVFGDNTSKQLGVRHVDDALLSSIVPASLSPLSENSTAGSVEEDRRDSTSIFSRVARRVSFQKPNERKRPSLSLRLSFRSRGYSIEEDMPSTPVDEATEDAAVARSASATSLSRKLSRSSISGGDSASDAIDAAIESHLQANTVEIGAVFVSALMTKEVRAVACGGRHTCALVATEWIHDSESSKCMNPRCGVEFTVIVRRHHCRNCGGIFCSKCSSHRMPLLKLGFIEPVRVCSQCYIRLQQQ